MAKAVFISFDHDDAQQVGGLRASISNPNHDIDFLDRSLKEPVKDQYGNVINVPPHDARAARIKTEIIGLMKTASKMVVLIGKNTHSSLWVKWEIEKFLELKKNNRNRILCMRLKNEKSAGAPAGFKAVDWDLDMLVRWINQSELP